MKLKYYLRGVGTGIIFATLVMAVSCLVHKYNLSDEFIIREARKLGMVKEDEIRNENSLWGNDDTEDVTEDTEDTQVMGSEVQPSESEGDSQTPSESDPPVEQNPPVEPDSPAEPDPPVEPDPPAEPDTPVEPDPPAELEYVTLVIEKGDYARAVAEKLLAAGVIDDSEEFRKYIGSHGYGQMIKGGTFKIPKDATYEEICKIITKKP